MPFLLFFTALCIGATFFIADVPPIVGLALFIVANFAYQAALIYYDATLKTVELSGDPRASCPGSGPAIGYCGTIFVGLLIFLLDIPVVDRFRLSAAPVPASSRSRSSCSCASRGSSAPGRGHAGGRPRLVRPAAPIDRARARRCPGCGGSSSAASSTRTRSTRSSSS